MMNKINKCVKYTAQKMLGNIFVYIFLKSSKIHEQNTNENPMIPVEYIYID